ncbi:MAG: tetratricopeptide repeat protein [Cytophagales bacterium]|nr:tetratricopeptide repeat protein [Bernardetiaceae bacterium]MDW8209875.1 tetratricopeptide repeat protein [Cytophagales bacterium]
MARKSKKSENPLVQRFEQMLAEGESTFFDLHEFEDLIEYYASCLQWQKVWHVCQAALALYPFASELEIEKARALVRQGKYQHALQQIEKAAVLHPYSEELYTLQAEAFAGLQMFPQAIESLLIALEHTAEKEEIHLRIAELYQHCGKLQQAAEHWLEVVKINPDNAEAVKEAAQALKYLRHTNYGAHVLETLIDNHPEEFRHWRNAAIFHNQIGNFHKAIELLGYALALNEEESTVWYYLGHAQMNLNRYQEAETSYKKAIELQEKNSTPDAEMYCCLAATYEKRKEYAQAARFYRKAIHLDQRCANGWYGLGMCLIARQRWYEAIGFLKKSVRLDNQREEYWLALATAEWKTGNVVSAIEAYQQASYINPSNPQVWLDWSEIYRQQGDYKKAIDLLEEGLEECLNHADLHYRLCVCCLEAGKYKQSFAYLENALTLDFDRHTVLYEWIQDLNLCKVLFKIISQYER